MRKQIEVLLWKENCLIWVQTCQFILCPSRRSISKGESVKYLIPDSVIEYIRQHNLYQVTHIFSAAVVGLYYAWIQCCTFMHYYIGTHSYLIHHSNYIRTWSTSIMYIIALGQAYFSLFVHRTLKIEELSPIPNCVLICCMYFYAHMVLPLIVEHLMLIVCWRPIIVCCIKKPFLIISVTYNFEDEWQLSYSLHIILCIDYIYADLSILVNVSYKTYAFTHHETFSQEWLS